MSREESVQNAFDAYCKRLVKNEAIGIHRKYVRQEKREVVFSEFLDMAGDHLRRKSKT